MAVHPLSIPYRRRNPDLSRSVAAALLGAASAFAAPAAFAQASPPIVNDYQIMGSIQPDVWLTSSVDCGVVRCDLMHVITSRPLDAIVNVTWKDKHGATLVSASSAYWSNLFSPEIFDGYLEATGWTTGLFGSAFVPPTPIRETGTADFTGSIGILHPCGGFVCNDADYYAWPPSPFSVPAGGGGAGARMAALAAPQPLVAMTGTLEVVGMNPATPEDVTSGPSAGLIEFMSTVEQSGSDYVYRYVVTNLTGVDADYEWTEAGLTGSLGPLGSAERTVTSSLAPTMLATVARGAIKQTDPFVITSTFAGGLGMLTPVPEPQSWAMLAMGLGVLGLVRSRRRSGRMPA